MRKTLASYSWRLATELRRTNGEGEQEQKTGKPGLPLTARAGASTGTCTCDMSMQQHIVDASLFYSCAPCRAPTSQSYKHFVSTEHPQAFDIRVHTSSYLPQGQSAAQRLAYT